MPTDLRRLLHENEIPVDSNWDFASLRVKARKRRILFAAGSMIASAVVVAAGMFGYTRLIQDKSVGSLPSSFPSRLGEPTVATGSDGTVDFSLIDGARGEIRFSSDLGLGERDMQIMGQVSLVGVDDELVTPLRFEYEPDRAVGSPEQSRTDSSGGKEYRWDAVIRPGDEFVLQIGPWALYFQRSSEWSLEDRLALQENLWGWVNESGFIALEADFPVRVWGGNDYPALPRLYVGEDLILTSGCQESANGDVEEWDGTMVRHIRDGIAEGIDFWWWCTDRWLGVGVIGSEEKARDIFDNTEFTKVTVDEMS